MRQTIGDKLTADSVAAAPADSADAGFDLETTQGQAKVMKWLLILTATAAVDWDLYARDMNTKEWMNATALVSNYAKTIVGRRCFLVENIGVFDQLVVVGAATITATKLQEYIENNFLRGD